MDENDNIYSEALHAAKREALELDQEIGQLRKLLVQLEERKLAVDDVCHALGKWVDLSGGVNENPTDPFDSIFEDQGGETIRLSEEEVSLIAYPDGPPPGETPR